MTFRAAPLPRPFHLLGGLATLPGLGWREKAGLWRLGGAFFGGESLDGLTVAAWLDRARAPRAARELVLEPLALAALNEAPEVASALPFAVTMRELLRAGNRGCAIGLATAGLGDAYAPAAGTFIELAGGKVLPGSWARELLVGGSPRARGVRLADGKELEGDAVVAAVPPWDLVPLIAGVPALARLASAAGSFSPSPIVTAHLWRDPATGPAPFTGLPGARFDWLFNRTAIVGKGKLAAEHLCLVKSGARALLGLKPDALVALAEETLERHLPEARGGQTIHSRVIWETKATVSLTPGTAALRPAAVTTVPGFVLAGDWVRTGLPATIESAVRGGFAAA
ncbi:MAG: FAD-dependent oxidoreductase, partial [bacterium]